MSQLTIHIVKALLSIPTSIAISYATSRILAMLNRNGNLQLYNGVHHAQQLGYHKVFKHNGKEICVIVGSSFVGKADYYVERSARGIGLFKRSKGGIVEVMRIGETFNLYHLGMAYLSRRQDGTWVEGVISRGNDAERDIRYYMLYNMCIQDAILVVDMYEALTEFGVPTLAHLDGYINKEVADRPLPPANQIVMAPPVAFEIEHIIH